METTSVVLVCGVADEPMAVSTISLLWDLPSAVSVHHAIDVARSVLTRTVSDVTGVLEREEIDVEHACVSCAIREDILPTLERLAAHGRWQAVVARLPVAAEATQVCRALGEAPERFPHVRIAGVVAALDGNQVCEDLLGNDLLKDRGLGTVAGDARGVGEVACAMVEYADVVANLGEVTVEGRDLLRSLSRPGALVLRSAVEIQAPVLLDGLHDYHTSEAWAAVIRRDPIVAPSGSRAWVLDFCTDLPLHPGRLLDEIAVLGGGNRRSRGCFWLPSRPDQVCEWDGAGGQLSIGATRRWAREAPITRIVVVGLDNAKEDLRAVLERCVLTPSEVRARGRCWEVSADGLEPWLGPARRVA